MPERVAFYVAVRWSFLAQRVGCRNVIIWFLLGQERT
jgi:hypothetical protein